MNLLSIPLTFILLIGVTSNSTAQQGKARVFKGSEFLAEFNDEGLSRFSSTEDKFNANIVAKDEVWGNVNLKYRVAGGDWLSVYKDAAKAELISPNKMSYTDYKKGVVMKMERTFEKVGKALDFTIKIQTMMNIPVTIGDLSITLPWAKPAAENPNYIFEQTFIKHQYIAGNASFCYFTRASGEPPFLVVMTKPGTQLEYFESSPQFTAFIHSGMPAEKEERGTWRMPNTTLQLAAAREKGSSAEYGFRLEWANSYEDLRKVLYENGLFDTRVVPGMTLPQGLTAKFSIHTKNRIDSVTAEYPQQTSVKLIEKKEPGYFIYEVKFDRLGENKLTINYNGDQKSILEFFSTEPVETLIKKRSAFLVTHQQHTDTAKWYNGLYSMWDMKNKVLRGPDNTDGFDFWWGYVLSCDDIGLCKAPFIASKNVYMPDDAEIKSVEYYIKNFVWGGLQRTDKELPNPYGIYGVPNWHEARDPLLRARSRDYNLDKMKIWRSYDYPHIIKMYYHMFQIAERYPEKVSYLDAKGYLERAFQTAKAYFTYPYHILHWYDTYKWGCYNEMILLPLIADLERYGRKEDADWLRSEWEKKVKYFVYDDKYPFRSEYSIDRTAFESSYAFAKYGTLNKMKPDKNLWYDVNLKKWYSHPEVKQSDSRFFMDRQNTAGLAVRGWINPAYYTLGSDDSETGGLSYMARMGGWSILDYGLQFAEKPFDWLQLGYASYLSSFALMNTGTAASGYGYWFPGTENDGATGWAFNSQKYGQTWLQNRSMPRGPWNYDGEADLGLGAVTRAASTIIANDPLFGWIAYGGELKIEKNKLSVIPEDGVGIRFSIVTGTHRISAELSRDRLSTKVPVITDKYGQSILFTFINETGKVHHTQLKLTGTNGDAYLIKVNRKNAGKTNLQGASEILVDLNMPASGCTIELLKIK
jgi:hypothetical protein